MKRTFVVGLAVLGALAVSLGGLGAKEKEKAGKDARVFEMRTYIANEGKLDALNARFRDHTNRLFEKHGITLIGYWTPTESPASENTLIYILAYPSREAADASWKAFREDPAWNKAREESEKDGKLVKEVKSVYMNPTDYSPIK